MSASQDDLDGKVIVVTGGGSGIGRAVCKAAAGRGARVAVVDVDIQAANETARELETETLSIATDVSDERQVKAMVAQILSRWERIDGLHNHAGILHGDDASILEVTEQAIDRTLAVNVKGMMLVAKHVARAMVAAGKGAIVNTASDLAFIAVPNACSYIASKSAITGLTRAMATELAGKGVRVNAVCPGFVHSRMTSGLAENRELMASMLSQYPIGRLGQPADVAGLVLFLLSDAASFMLGTSVLVDGGHTIQ
jgi:NAD(P)-dependent dehydrogenase (short-subunit alcohol dehydrogenase family)